MRFLGHLCLGNEREQDLPKIFLSPLIARVAMSYLEARRGGQDVGGQRGEKVFGLEQ